MSPVRSDSNNKRSLHSGSLWEIHICGFWNQRHHASQQLWPLTETNHFDSFHDMSSPHLWNWEYWTAASIFPSARFYFIKHRDTIYHTANLLQHTPNRHSKVGLLVKLVLGEYHRNPIMISQVGFITWANVDISYGISSPQCVNVKKEIETQLNSTVFHVSSITVFLTRQEDNNWYSVQDISIISYVVGIAIVRLLPKVLLGPL